MLLQSRLLAETVQFAATDAVLVLNSAADPFVSVLQQRLQGGRLLLAEDNIATLKMVASSARVPSVRTLPFHDYILQSEGESVDVAVMNLLYQPSNAWMLYGLRAAFHALKPGGRLYIVGAKERGVLTMARHMERLFGNKETLVISKGQRVILSRKLVREVAVQVGGEEERAEKGDEDGMLHVFADSKLDEGTELLLATLQIQPTDVALDLGCGAGYIGLHIAHVATQGAVTMVDVSLAAVAASQEAVRRSGLTNIVVLPSDGIEAVSEQRFDLVATNPPFHQGGIQTTETAERFIREAAIVLRPEGRFYLVANRFLKYETTLQSCFRHVTEVAGNTRYKVLQATSPSEKRMVAEKKAQK